MDKRLEKLTQIENDFPIESIRVQNEAFWPFFRLLIFSQLYSDVIQVHRKSPLTPLFKLRNAFFGIFNWWKSWDYIFFSNEQERKNIDGKIFDKLTDHGIESLGYRKSLYIEHVEKFHLPAASYRPKRVSSFDFVLVVTGLLKLFNRHLKQVEIQNEKVLVDILAKLEITLDYRTKLHEFITKAKVLKTIFQLTRPKIIFITDYGNMPAVYAANGCGIKTVEFQHGVIGTVHPYYHPSKKLSSSFCPSYLMVFGEHDYLSLSHGNYVKKEGIFPIGNFLLDKIRKLPPRQDILDLTKRFTKSVCVPTDRITHDYLFSFVQEVAPDLPDTLFIIVPRSTSYLGKTTPQPSINIHFETTHSFQDTVRHCSVNSCTNSTCSLEALTLGIPNILIDEDGLASLYYGNILTNTKTTKFAKTKTEYKRLLKDHVPVSSDLVIASNQRNYVPNYQANFQTAISQITS